MATKVFKLNNQWLFCSDVSYSDGVYRGFVVNGNWKFIYDENRKELHVLGSPLGDDIYDVQKIWACDPYGGNYNSVIENANKRYEEGEQPNFKLPPDPEENLEDIITF